jgi:ABC-type multidrug transport system fused ATPase/permease subunit
MTKGSRLRALQNQIRRLQGRLEELERVSGRFAWARLAVIVIGFILSGAAFFLVGPWLLAITLALNLVAFAIVVHFHRQIEDGIAKYRIWLDTKTAQVARARLDWANMPPATLQQEHPLELDFDLVGEHSLHRLLDTAVSDGGSRRLREWLATTNPDPEESVRRQQLAQELAPLSLFRGKLILNGTLASNPHQKWHSDRLLTWLKRREGPSSLRAWLLLSAVLAALNILFLVLYLLASWPPIWLATFVLYFSLYAIKSRELDKPFKEASHLRDALEQLLAVFQQLETYTYRTTPFLRALCAPFLDPSDRPSNQLRRINRIVNATGIRGNPIFWFILNVLVPWDFYFAYQLEKYKDDIADRLPQWMNVWFELEALSSLANLAYLNPHYTFPEIAVAEVVNESTDDRSENDRPAVFQARDLGHPLLPEEEKVCNNFTVEKLGQVGLFTGSNMSGKSTFLRTVGTNLILAFAGGPVNAAYLRTIPFRLHTCIRISDSVTDGVSYFYAEVKCLKSLLTELESQQGTERALNPLFYFVDEIFRGTNNRERLIGSRAYIQAVAGKYGVGIIATHDLELIHLAEEIPAIKNYHFTDDVVDGRMVFDYKLHPGPSPTTNAVKIMQMEGLPIPSQTQIQTKFGPTP